MTILFVEGEIDLILVPESDAKAAKAALLDGRYANSAPLSEALNQLATILSGGYRFVKGEPEWGQFYAAVKALPGFRISDVEAKKLADEFLIDAFWVFQKLERGELTAAQRMIHRSLIETNIVLLHELRVRKSQETYQQARRVEMLASVDELRTVQFSVELDAENLRRTAWSCIEGLQFLMSELTGKWELSDKVRGLFSRYTSPITPER